MQPPKIIFVHMPKAAGSSQLKILEDIYGHDEVFWWPRIYGRNVKTLQGPDTPRWAVSGGHIPLKNYDMPHNKHALVLSLLREPVARVLSLFDFCARPDNAPDLESRQARTKMQTELMDDGFVPSSIKQSIERSEVFRNHCTNAQCGHLSLYEPTLAGVERTLAGHNHIIGVTDAIVSFHQMLRQTLGWQASNIAINKSEKPPPTHLLREPGLLDLLRSINQQDEALYRFVNSRENQLWSHFPSLDFVRYFLSRPPKIEPCDLNTLTGVSISAPREISFAAGVPTRVKVDITNGSRHRVCALRERGLFVSYHLFDKQGHRMEHHGQRTLVPCDVLPQSVVTVDVTITIPKRYEQEVDTLEIGMLYEGKAWFPQVAGVHAARVRSNNC